LTAVGGKESGNGSSGAGGGGGRIAAIMQADHAAGAITTNVAGGYGGMGSGGTGTLVWRVLGVRGAVIRVR
jgi:hypothetical protein